MAKGAVSVAWSFINKIAVISMVTLMFDAESVGWLDWKLFWKARGERVGWLLLLSRVFSKKFTRRLPSARPQAQQVARNGRLTPYAADAYFTHSRALRHICIHGLCADASPLLQLIWILRKTRSGWGIMAVKRPSFVVTAVRPPGLPLGLAGYCSVDAPWLSVKRIAGMTLLASPLPPCAGLKLAKPSPWATAIGSLAPSMPAKKRLGDGMISTMLRRASKRVLVFWVKRGQASAPGMMSANSANIWQPLHTPRPKLLSLLKKASN